MKKRTAVILIASLISITFCACNKDTAVDTAQEANNPSDKAAYEENTGDDSDNATTIPTQPKEESITPEPDNDYTNSLPVILETPPFNYFLSDKGKPIGKEPISLTMKSSASNEITDIDKWLIDNNLFINTYEVPNPFQNTAGNLPKEIATQWDDLIITSAFYDDSYIYCTYGSYFNEGYKLSIYDRNTLEIIYKLDFSNYCYSPEYIAEDFDFIRQRINWAEIKDNILFVSHSHDTYAKSSNNMNAYITAIDLSDLSILWRTEPLVSNTANFQMIDDIIISGYGFTDEPDFLYQIDASSGKIIEQVPLKSAAEYIIQKDNLLYVRTYNTNYEFEIAR
jgi:hypothetical protein